MRRLIEEMNQRAQNRERQDMVQELRRLLDQTQEKLQQLKHNIDQRAENREDPVAEIRREQEKC